MNRIHHFLLVAAVFVMAGAASYGLWQHERSNAAADRRATLDFNLREIAGNIEQRMASYEQAMRGVQGLIAASGQVPPQNLQTYLDALQMGADFAGLGELSVVRLHPSAGSPNPYQDPAQRTAMDAARDSGRPKTTGKLPPTAATGAPLQSSFAMFLPLYQGGQQPANQTERRAQLLGWVMATVRMQELMASLYGPRALASDIQIHEGVQMSDATLMFDSTPSTGSPSDTDIALTEYLVLAGRTWSVTARSRADAVLSSGKDSSDLLALGGAGFSLLLALFAWVLITGRARALAKATEMTAELRDVKEHFELLFETSPDAVIVSRSPDGTVVETNNQLSTLMGFARGDLVGKRMVDIPLWADPAVHQQFIAEVNTHGFCENFEAHFLRKDGARRVCLISARQIQIRDVAHIISITRDINERKETELRMTHMAQHDPLTGLPNRALFDDRLKQALAHAKRDQTRLALMFLDLDHFKPVNDTLGHAVGDLLLQAAAVRMAACVRQSDTVGRIGGDEFVILLPDIRDDQDALLVALKIRQALEQPFLLAGAHTVQISCSTGIATFPEHGDDELTLSKNADAGMYLAKDRGRNRVELFSPA